MLKKAFAFIKDNLSVIAIIPLILGGIWQILSLVSISFSYLRFFSVTQQIADGVTILSFFLLIIIIFYATSITVSNNFLGLSKSLNFRYWSILWRLILCLIGIGIFSFKLYNEVKIVNYRTFSLLIDTTNLIISFSSLLYAFQVLLIIAITVLIKLKVVSFNKLSQPIDWHEWPFTLMRIIYIPLVLTLCVLLYFAGVYFHKYNSIPGNLKNTKYVLDKYCSENTSSHRDSIMIIYMNDKYIFIQDKKEVEVVKIDYMFRSSK